MKNKVIMAREVMHKNYLEIDGKATVKEALRIMRNNKYNLLVIKKRDEHDAIGLVVLSDIVKKVLAKDKAPERVNAYEIMSKPVISVDPDLDVRYCARLFSRFGLSNAPVIENGQVIGIVSYNELVYEGLCELLD